MGEDTNDTLMHINKREPKGNPPNRSKNNIVHYSKLTTVTWSNGVP